MQIIVQSFIYGALLILVIMGVLFLYKYLKPSFVKTPMILIGEKSTQLDPKFSVKFPPNDIVLPDLDKGDKLGLSFGFQLYIENAMENEKWGSRFDKLKPIINYSPSIYYHPYENYLEFAIEIKDNIQMTSYETVKYRDPPLQKWINCIAVFNSDKIQIYIDGELKITKKIKNPPIIKPRHLQVGHENNNIQGQFGRFVYWPYPLEYTEIKRANNFLIYG
jgi:hypothetical protein